MYDDDGGGDDGDDDDDDVRALFLRSALVGGSWLRITQRLQNTLNPKPQTLNPGRVPIALLNKSVPQTPKLKPEPSTSPGRGFGVYGLGFGIWGLGFKTLQPLPRSHPLESGGSTDWSEVHRT